MALTGGAGFIGWSLKSNLTNFATTVKELTAKVETLTLKIVETKKDQSSLEKWLERLEEDIKEIKQKQNL